MKHDMRLNFGSAWVLGLVGSAVLAACSAGGGNTNHFPGGGNGNTGANGPSGGNGSEIIGGGGDAGGGAYINGAGTGKDGGAGGGQGGSSGGGTSIGPQGPQVTQKCNGGPSSNTNVKWLYPYDGTIFPRGLAGPLLMWDAGVKADSIHYVAKSATSGWVYEDCPKTPDGVRYQLPADMWTGAGSWSKGTGDPITVQVTMMSGSNAIGSATFTVKFALANLKGAIYYNTYGSKLPGASPGNGAVLKLLPGQAQPTVFLTDTGAPPIGPCRSCHSLSARGSVMAANHHAYPGVYQSELYTLSSKGALSQPTQMPANVDTGFAGLSPDGSMLMSNGAPNGTYASGFFPIAPGNVTALVVSTSQLLNPKDGSVIPSTGWNVQHAQMPMFSPDGLHIVYNDADKGPKTSATIAAATAMVGGHSLWVQDFDPVKKVFSNPREIASDPTLYLGWPFFTSDNTHVVYVTDTRSDFTSQTPDPVGLQAFGGTWPGPGTCQEGTTCVGHGHLMIVPADGSKQMVPLDLANGYKGGQSYLPAGKDRDNEYETFSTVSPFGGDGYAFAFFSSRRTYGNLLTQDANQPTSKQIWVTAINLGTPNGQDPSAPAFYLPGQEMDSGNIRAFTALEPCKEDGSDCTSGLDCCNGFCSDFGDGKGFKCGKPTVPTCSKKDEACTTTADCCTGDDNGASGKKLKCLSVAGSSYCQEEIVK